MNPHFIMLLQWARGNVCDRNMAFGYMMRDEVERVGQQRLDDVERMYVRNIINARIFGVSA